MIQITYKNKNKKQNNHSPSWPITDTYNVLYVLYVSVEKGALGLETDNYFKFIYRYFLILSGFIKGYLKQPYYYSQI